MSERKMFDILVNQVGYDTEGGKRFVVQSEMDLSHHNGTYVLKEKNTNTAVYHGDLTYFGKVYEGTPNDWGFWYWTGDFSDFGQAGEYVIEVEIGETKAASLLWRRTARSHSVIMPTATTPVRITRIQVRSEAIHCRQPA